eukprot:scaffold31948_cov69-Cyclotella_meneghiniana.AAC.2
MNSSKIDNSIVATMNTSKIDALAKAAEESSQLQNNGTDTPESSIPVKQTERSSDEQQKMSFADKIDAILAVDEYSSIVSWLPTGKSFAIMDKEQFIKEVLPRFFKDTKFESFHRRLKRWGFRTAYTNGNKQVVYTNDLFIKNRPELRRMMSGNAGNNAQVRGHHMQPAMMLQSQHHHGHPAAYLTQSPHQQMCSILQSQHNYPPHLVNVMQQFNNKHLVPNDLQRDPSIRLSQLDGEIFELEEQLKTLYKLRALEAKGRRF